MHHQLGWGDECGGWVRLDEHGQLPQHSDVLLGSGLHQVERHYYAGWQEPDKEASQHFSTFITQGIKKEKRKEKIKTIPESITL